MSLDLFLGFAVVVALLAILVFYFSSPRSDVWLPCQDRRRVDCGNRSFLLGEDGCRCCGLNACLSWRSGTSFLPCFCFLYLFFTNTVVWRHWASDRVMVRYNFSEETEYYHLGSLFQWIMTVSLCVALTLYSLWRAQDSTWFLTCWPGNSRQVRIIYSKSRFWW